MHNASQAPPTTSKDAPSDGSPRDNQPGPGTSHQPLRTPSIQPHPPTANYYQPYHAPPGHAPQATPFNMTDVAAALPQYGGYGPQPASQQFGPPHGMMYPMPPHMPSFPGPVPGSANMPYPMGYQNPYAHPHQQQSTAQFPQGTSTGSAYVAYPPYPHRDASTNNPGYSPSYPRQGPYHAGSALPSKQSGPRHGQSPPKSDKERKESSSDVSWTIVDGSRQTSRTHTPGSRSPRGTAPAPSRKPKQSGHALWVGNLPPGTNVVDLKDHFARDATHDIESVFLISKSNCAFVNYRTEESCTAAAARFHDSWFQGARLVCRIRRGLAGPGSGAHQGSPHTGSGPRQETALDKPEEDSSDARERQQQPGSAVTTAPRRVPERYFIVKSLTVEDLEWSRHIGIWTTQIHNEAVLNQAYEVCLPTRSDFPFGECGLEVLTVQTADNVYLIFSANKSGEYFGYARMASPIRDDPGLAMELASRPEYLSPEVIEALQVTPTEATNTAPSGRIIEDHARGTIFWEADTSDSSSAEEDSSHDGEGGEERKPEGETPSGKSAEDETTGASGQTLGRPFRIEWISTQRVPFYRTRGLRNPWNANREVKVARDGTEVEPSVGRKLTQLFHSNLRSY